MSIIINEGTESTIYTTQIGGTETGIVRLDVGVGTTVDNFGGTIRAVANLAKGTVTKLEGGTLGEVTSLTTLSNLTNGSVNILTGTIQSVGTNVGIGTLSNVGSINTVTSVSSVANFVKGTVTKLEGGSISLYDQTSGSLLNLIVEGATFADSRYGIMAYARGTGTGAGAVVKTLLVDSNQNLRTAIQDGTITALTLGTMKILATPAGSSILSQGTLGTAGGSFFATLSALSGSGTRTYVTNTSIVMHSGTADVRILAGTAIQGTGVITAGQFPAGGGIADRFFPPFDAGDNSILSYHFVGAGTAFITIKYFKST